MTNADTMILAAVVGIVFLTLALGLAAAFDPNRRILRRRIAEVQFRHAPASITENADLRRDVHTGSFSIFEQLAKRLIPDPQVLAKKLARTGRSISIGAYAAAVTAIAVFLFFGLNFGLGFGLMASLSLGVIVGLAVPHTAVNIMGARRINKFTAILPDAIDLLVRGLRSGLPISECIASVGREVADPVGVEFRAVAEGVRLGQTLEDALWDTAERLDTAEFKFFVISLAVQKETGGNLAETLGNLSEILRKRKQMKLKIKAMSSEARASAYILGSLPFIMLGIISVLNTEYAMTLFTEPRGRVAAGVGFGMMLVGWGVMFKMVRFEI